MSNAGYIYKVIDTHTGAVMGTYTSRIRATRRADALDNAYGAIRFAVRSEVVS